MNILYLGTPPCIFMSPNPLKQFSLVSLIYYCHNPGDKSTHTHTHTEKNKNIWREWRNVISSFFYAGFKFFMLFAFAQRVLLHKIGENNTALKMRINFVCFQIVNFFNVASAILDFSLLLPVKLSLFFFFVSYFVKFYASFPLYSLLSYRLQTISISCS